MSTQKYLNQYLNQSLGKLFGAVVFCLSLSAFGAGPVYRDSGEYLVLNRIENTKKFSFDKCLLQKREVPPTEVAASCADKSGKVTPCESSRLVNCQSMINNQTIDLEVLAEKLKTSEKIFIQNNIKEYQSMNEEVDSTVKTGKLEEIGGFVTMFGGTALASPGLSPVLFLYGWYLTEKGSGKADFQFRVDNSDVFSAMIKVLALNLKDAKPDQLVKTFYFAQYYPEKDSIRFTSSYWKVKAMSFEKFMNGVNALMYMSAEEYADSASWQMCIWNGGRSPVRCGR